jgi:hypothetical protein
LLIKAQIELHNLAEKIDKVHKENSESYGVDQQSILQIIQDLIENLDDVRIFDFECFTPIIFKRIVQ